MANYEIPQYPTKRLRYFNNQFLRDQDFIDDNSSQIGRERAFLRSLFVAGVCEGMAVSYPAADKPPSVGAGIAIDQSGRMIVLDLPTEGLAAPGSLADGEYVVHIRFLETEDDRATGKGTLDYTRWRQAPVIAVTAKTAALPDGVVVLGSCTVAGGVFVGPGTAGGRQYSGLRLPGANRDVAAVLRNSGAADDLAVLSGSLTVRRDTGDAVGPVLALTSGNSYPGGAGAALDFNPYDPGANAPALRLQSLGDDSGSSHLAVLTKAPGSVANTLVERLRVTSAGHVGIGTQAPSDILHVYSTDTVGLLESSTAQAALRLATSEGAANRIELANRAGGRAAIWVGTAGDAFNVTKNGNVGIGTQAPGDILHVRSVDTVGLLESSTTQAALRLATSEGMANHVELANRSGGRAAIWVGTAGDAFNVMKDGNVGIGTQAPSDILHVRNASADTVGLFESSTAQAALRLATLEGMTNRIELANRAGGRAAIWVGTAGDAFNVMKNGNVGVGTQTPSDILHVRNADTVGLLESSTTQAALRLATSEGTANHVKFANRPGGHAAISVGTAGDALLVRNDGQVIVSKASGGVGDLTVENSLRFPNDLPKDKIVLWEGSGGVRYGMGLNSSNINLFYPTNARFSLRQNSATGTEVFSVDGSGTTTLSGPIAGSLTIRSDVSGQLGPTLTLQNSAGAAGAGGAIDFNGYDTGTGAPSLRLQSLSDGNSSSHLAFSTKAPGASTNSLVERLRLTSDGLLKFPNETRDKIVLWDNGTARFGIGANSDNLNLFYPTTARFSLRQNSFSGTEVFTVNGSGIATFSGAIVPKVGNDASSGIYFPTNPGGGTGDEAFLRYYATSGETTTLALGINNEPADALVLWQAGAERINISNGTISLTGNARFNGPIDGSLMIRRDVRGQLGPTLTLQNSTGSPGAGGAIDFNGCDTGTNDPTLRLRSLDDGNFSSHLTFSTKRSGANTNNLVERLRLTSDGILKFPNEVPKDKIIIWDTYGIGLNDANINMFCPAVARFSLRQSSSTGAEVFSVSGTGAATFYGPIIPKVGNNTSSGIYFPTNPGGGTGDEAFLRYYATSGETTTLVLGINNEPADALVLWQAGAERINISNGTISLTGNAQFNGSGTATFSGAIVPRVGNDASSGIYFPTNPGGGTGDEAFLRYYATTGETAKLVLGINNEPDDALVLYQAGAERINISNGTISLTGNAQFNGPIAGSLTIRSDVSGQLGPTLTLQNSAGSSGAGGAIDFNGYDTGTSAPSLRLQSLNDGNSSSHLTFSTKEPGANTNNLVERLRLTSDGLLKFPNEAPKDKIVFWDNGTNRFGIGVAPDNINLFYPTNARFSLRQNSTTGTEVYTIDGSGNGWTRGQMTFQQPGTGTGRVSMWYEPGSGGHFVIYPPAGNGVYLVFGLGWVSNSDATLKTEIVGHEPVLDRVMQLRPVRYAWKADGSEGSGFIAQEVEALFPDLVHEGPLDEATGRRSKGLSYERFSVLAVAAIQELKTAYDTRLDALERRLAALEGKS